MIDSRKPKHLYKRFHRTAEVSHGTEIFRCFCTAPRDVVWTFRHWNIFGSLPIASSVLPLWLEFVQNYQLGWHLLKQQFLHVDPTECFSKGTTIGEVRGVRSGWGQKGGMSSGVLSKELLMCQLRVTAAVWTRGCPCWCNVVALGALRVSEPFHMLRLCKRLFQREKHQNESPGGITSKLISTVLELFLMWGVSLNHLLNFFSAEVAYS